MADSDDEFYDCDADEGALTGRLTSGLAALDTIRYVMLL